MARYIDADLFKLELEKGHNNGDITGRTDVEKLLDEQPTADVKEVVRGKWVKSVFAKDFHKCSECEGVWNRKFVFCPSCGAEMKGVE